MFLRLFRRILPQTPQGSIAIDIGEKLQVSVTAFLRSGVEWLQRRRGRPSFRKKHDIQYFCRRAGSLDIHSQVFVAPQAFIMYKTGTLVNFSIASTITSSFLQSRIVDCREGRICYSKIYRNIYKFLQRFRSFGRGLRFFLSPIFSGALNSFLKKNP